MPKPDWTWLIIGLILGYFVFPSVVAQVRGMTNSG